MYTQGPSRRPCQSCPYRRDVPPGIWTAEEYRKLPEYDRPTSEQPRGIFLCHQNGRDDPNARVCAGWAGCHGKTHETELISVRMGIAFGTLTETATLQTLRYKSPVPLFDSGAEAAAHGLREIENPGPEAQKLIKKITRTRKDVR